MNERINQPFQPVVVQPTETPARPLPDYSAATAGQLRRAQAQELTHLITADVSHFVLKGLVLARQIFAFLRGEDVIIDWDPDVKRLRPDLDKKEQHATENLQAIWREQSLRRSIRQELHNK